jgi:hypothetical protein
MWAELNDTVVPAFSQRDQNVSHLKVLARWRASLLAR